MHLEDSRLKRIFLTISVVIATTFYGLSAYSDDFSYRVLFSAFVDHYRLEVESDTKLPGNWTLFLSCQEGGHGTMEDEIKYDPSGLKSPSGEVDGNLKIIEVSSPITGGVTYGASTDIYVSKRFVFNPDRGKMVHRTLSGESGSFELRVPGSYTGTSVDYRSSGRALILKGVTYPNVNGIVCKLHENNKNLMLCHSKIDPRVVDNYPPVFFGFKKAE